MRQQEYIEATFVNPGYQTLTIEQRGPDGTEVLGLVLFLSCPVCRAVVPANLEGVDIDHGDEHKRWHLAEASKQDEVVESFNRMSAAVWPQPEA